MSEQTQTQEEIIEQYAAGSKHLDEALEGLSEADLDLARADGKWTIRKIVHHIADSEDLWKISIKAALGNSGCTFDISWYLADNKCAEPLDYASRPIVDAVELFKISRRHVVEIVNHLPGAWELFIFFTRDDMAEVKKFTVGDIISWQIRHLNIHLDQIRETREKHGI